MDIKGKRLLILGSTELIAGIVRKCRELGVISIVTDNRPLERAPAKRIADRYCDVDFSDREGIDSIIRTEHIDGVLTGFTDSYMSFYVDICKRNGLPCYMEPHQLAIATDKAAFKEACIGSGVPIIPGRVVPSQEEAAEFARELGFPVMLKPVDNSGSRGVVKCDEPLSLNRAYEYALSFSGSGRVMVEKYLECNNIAVSYFIADGKICLSTTDDRMVYKDLESGSSISCYSEYPSKYTERYIREIDAKARKMLSENGFRNGMVSFQAFVDDRSFYFCEMCYRPSGGQHYNLTQRFNGVDQLALLIEFAVTGSCLGSWKYENETPFFQNNCAMLRILGVPGRKIKTIRGFDELCGLDHVIKAYQVVNEGSVIGKSGTTAQVIGNVVYTFSRDHDRQTIADSILEHIKVLDETGESIAWITLGQ